jgi:hypothetical protein
MRRRGQARALSSRKRTAATVSVKIDMGLVLNGMVVVEVLN